MRKPVFVAVTAISLVIPFSPAQARVKVWRCELDSGQISYQQFACARSGQQLELKIDRSGWSPLRAGEKELLKQYGKRDQAAARKVAVAGRPAAESRSCWSRRRQLQAVTSKLHRGYKLTESDELHRRQDEHEDFLRRFCAR